MEYDEPSNSPLELRILPVYPRSPHSGQCNKSSIELETHIFTPHQRVNRKKDLTKRKSHKSFLTVFQRINTIIVLREAAQKNQHSNSQKSSRARWRANLCRPYLVSIPDSEGIECSPQRYHSRTRVVVSDR